MVYLEVYFKPMFRFKSIFYNPVTIFFLLTIRFSFCFILSPWRLHGRPAADESESESPQQLKRKCLFIVQWENGEPLFETFWDWLTCALHPWNGKLKSHLRQKQWIGVLWSLMDGWRGRAWALVIRSWITVICFYSVFQPSKLYCWPWTNRLAWNKTM